MSQQTNPSKFRVGIVGATGAVGREMIRMLHALEFPVSSLVLMASERSVGKRVLCEFGELEVVVFSVDAARACDVVFLAVSGGFALEFARRVCEGEDGPIVIDNSSAFRNEEGVPLIVPEINLHAAQGHKLISNPNCTTAIAAMALWPLHQRFTITKLIVSTYQAASGAGQEGIQSLLQSVDAALQTKSLADGVCPNAIPKEENAFAHPLAFNLIPAIDTAQPNGYTREEMKVQWETRKIFGEPSLLVSCTAVRVPTIRAHAEAITLETKSPIDPAAAREVLATAPGVVLRDELGAQVYPMPRTASRGMDVEVGRIRQSLVFGANGLDLFVCGDQLLRGAAQNAVLIAKGMLKC